MTESKLRAHPLGAPTAKILIVDDERHQLDALERTLRPDFRVLRYDDGPSALLGLRENQDAAVVLCDLRMPGMGGLEVLSSCKAIAPTAVRAASSGAIDLRGMADAINTGSVDKFVLKPWEPDYLRLQMLEAVRAHESLRDKLILERLASTDPLTEVANRRHFDERVKVEFDRALRHERPFAVAMIDVDGFKRINDGLGHAVGDELLRKIGAILAGRIRNLDFVARYGGDEFAIVMPDTPIAAAFLVAERIRIAVESSSEPKATVSIGVAAYPDHTTALPALLHAADLALYRAKGQGRNQTVVAG